MRRCNDYRPLHLLVQYHSTSACIASPSCRRTSGHHHRTPALTWPSWPFFLKKMRWHKTHSDQLSHTIPLKLKPIHYMSDDLVVSVASALRQPAVELPTRRYYCCSRRGACRFLSCKASAATRNVAVRRRRRRVPARGRCAVPCRALRARMTDGLPRVGVAARLRPPARGTSATELSCWLAACPAARQWWAVRDSPCRRSAGRGRWVGSRGCCHVLSAPSPGWLCVRLEGRQKTFCHWDMDTTVRKDLRRLPRTVILSCEEYPIRINSDWFRLLSKNTLFCLGLV